MPRENNFRYDSSYNSEYKQRIQETVEYILSKSYGETLTNEELAHTLHYVIDNEDEFKKYKSTMGRIKNFLVEKGYILKSVSGVGYYILKPEQVAGHCYRTYVKRSSRMLDKSKQVMTYTDKSAMNDVRLAELQEMTNLTQKLIDTQWETIKTSAYYRRKAFYDNLR